MVCIVHAAADAASVGVYDPSNAFVVMVASEESLVFVNGKKLVYDREAMTLFRSNGSIDKVDGVSTSWLSELGRRQHSVATAELPHPNSQSMGTV